MQPAAAPAWVDAMRWQLLPLLRDKTDVRLDTRAHLHLEAWLDAAQERGWLTADPSGARGAVRAILCKSAREQAAFDTVFDGWLGAWDNPALAAGPKPDTSADHAKAEVAREVASVVLHSVWHLSCCWPE